ncbi:hypothetical protein [Terrimonas pollutisoli]|uniref:hypothetical protein n=1 Tax=Terrimonas pollutisoli TaxID=3034147 RepID=UPI0023EBDE92|nr:hypothetical protein [Terrimonas sp. H1YJ31]
MNDKNISSSPSGYVILSQLKDSTYNFKVGFPQNKWPEQDFSIAMKSNDHGFLLKNFNERGWGLFDLQTLNVVMAGKKEIAKIKTEPQAVSLFTEVLSKAANDPSLREKPVFAVVKEEKSISQDVVARQQDAPVKEKELQPKLEAKPAATIDSSKTTGIVESDEPKAETPKIVSQKEEISKLPQDSVQPQVAVKDKELEKKDSINASSMLKNVEDTKAETTNKIVALEETKTDTANKTIALERSPTSQKENTQPQTAYRRSVVLKKSESSSLEGLGLVFIDQYPGGEKDTISILIPSTAPLFGTENTSPVNEKKFLNIDDSKENMSSLAVNKTNCKAVASQNDFLKLRKKMAGQKDDEAMLTEAKKEFKLRCFSSEQVKNLGALFLNEPGKFQFYEAAYPYSSDPASFVALQNEFKDPYFIHRFKNMIK